MAYVRTQQNREPCKKAAIMCKDHELEIWVEGVFIGNAVGRPARSPQTDSTPHEVIRCPAHRLHSRPECIKTGIWKSLLLQTVVKMYTPLHQTKTYIQPPRCTHVTHALIFLSTHTHTHTHKHTHTHTYTRIYMYKVPDRLHS